MIEHKGRLNRAFAVGRFNRLQPPVLAASDPWRLVLQGGGGAGPSCRRGQDPLAARVVAGVFVLRGEGSAAGLVATGLSDLQNSCIYVRN